MSDLKNEAKDLMRTPMALIGRILQRHHEAMVEEIRDQVKRRTDEIQRLEARVENFESDMRYIKTRAGVGLDMRSERVDALNDIYETSGDALKGDNHDEGA